MKSDETQFAEELSRYSREVHQLYGIEEPSYKVGFIKQLQNSIQNVEFVSKIASSKLSPEVIDYNSDSFDPRKGAVYFHRRGKTDDTGWMVFFAIHFGENESESDSWRLPREIYGKLGEQGCWDWTQTSKDTGSFREWLLGHENQETFLEKCFKFGNHRKYQSLKDTARTGTGAAFESYVNWARDGGHERLFGVDHNEFEEDPRERFKQLFQSLNRSVVSFGRTACFDYLTLVRNLKLANIEPNSPYLHGATGPLTGAQLLFFGEGGGTRSSLLKTTMDDLLVRLGDEYLGVSMDVIEDALCNWQKNPSESEDRSDCSPSASSC